jgi:IS5 family transposase
MEIVVPWRELVAEIEPFYPKAGNDRPPVGVERMLRMYFLHRVNGYLESRGVKIGTGTIVDATLIEAPSSTKNKTGERDPEMHQVREANRIKSKTRSRVEHVFAPLKQRFGFVKMRYRGLAKNLHRLYTSFALINLITAQKLLAATGQ